MCGLSSPIWAGPSLLRPFMEFLATGERAAQPGAHRAPAWGCFHPRFLPTFFSLSCSRLVPAVLCHGPLLPLSPFKGPSGVLGFPSAAPWVRTPAASQALEPRMAQPSGVSWVSGAPAAGVLVPEDPSAFASSAGVSPGKKGPSTLASPLSFLRSGAAGLRMPTGAREAAPAGSLGSPKSHVPGYSLFPLSITPGPGTPLSLDPD